MEKKNPAKAGFSVTGKESLLGEVRAGEFPVHQSPEGVQVSWTRVAEVDVISVFPQVDGQQCSNAAVSQRRTGV